MAATIPTAFSPSMPREGQFSTPAGVLQDGNFLNAAHAARYSLDPVIRKHYYCNLIQRPMFGTWLTENMGYATSCYTKWNIIREFPTDNIVHLKNIATITIAAGAQGILPIANNSHYVGGAYVYPQLNDGLLLPPDGAIGKIMAITPGVNATTITVLNTSLSSVVIPIGADLIILPGKELAACDCPDGRIRWEDSPIEQTVTMKRIADPTGKVCGDALLACQNTRYAYEYMDKNGCLQTTELWYGGELTKLYQRHEEAKMYYFLFDPTFGIIPTLRANSIRWNWADPNTLTIQDIADLKATVQTSGLNCFEYSFALGSKAFASAQTLANTLGDGKISYGSFDPAECKWINLMYCTISISGMTIHFYEEFNFSGGKSLGAAGFDYKNRGIGIPMCDKPSECKRYGEDDNKMFTIVYFKDVLGNIHDNRVDSNGILNANGGKNNNGVLCDYHEWAIDSRFAVEVSCPYAWVLVNFPA